MVTKVSNTVYVISKVKDSRLVIEAIVLDKEEARCYIRGRDELMCFTQHELINASVVSNKDLEELRSSYNATESLKALVEQLRNETISVENFAYRVWNLIP